MLQRTQRHLDWMIQTLDFQNENTGIDKEDSPEMADARKLLAEIEGLME